MPASKIALLDVNVLVALFFVDHVHHDLAHDWFADHRQHGWATCPLTENGFVRVACRQSSAEAFLRPVDIGTHLQRFCSDPHHHTWTDAVSLLDPSLFAPQFIGGPQQITDIYLLGLATRMGGRLATFDRTIPFQAVQGATKESLQIIGP